MALHLKYCKHTLNFKFDAGTSRGILKSKDSYMIKIHDDADDNVFGLGEVSTIERLSFDYHINFEAVLGDLKVQLNQEGLPPSDEACFDMAQRLVPNELPAIRFALESALLDLLNGGRRQLFSNGFFTQQKTIPINGLIWMGDEAFIKSQIDQKLDEGFTCIKIKIGALDFDAECKILKELRQRASKEELTLRIDANGAFITQDVLKKLDALSQFDLHSIEQPIMPRQPHALQLICQKSGIPIALDEELIGVFNLVDKKVLLDDSRPQFIVLKPSLLGGIKATREWIDLAEERNIGWWITSGLESNIGLNAISQFACEYELDLHQGLGTGQLFENNIHSPLTVQGEKLVYHQNRTWDLSGLVFE